jgi:hypothetical protein
LLFRPALLKMDMIRHHHTGVHLAPALFSLFSEGSKIAVVIVVGVKTGGTIIIALNHVPGNPGYR